MPPQIGKKKLPVLNYISLLYNDDVVLYNNDFKIKEPSPNTE